MSDDVRNVTYVGEVGSGLQNHVSNEATLQHSQITNGLKNLGSNRFVAEPFIAAANDGHENSQNGFQLTQGEEVVLDEIDDKRVYFKIIFLPFTFLDTESWQSRKNANNVLLW